METKGRIRKEVLARRDALTEEERRQKSSMIMEKVLAAESCRRAENLLVYVNYKSEVCTEELIFSALEEGKAVYCPKVNGEEMDFYRILSMRDLREGYRGIREPEAAAERLFDSKNAGTFQTMLLMPGSVFDRNRNRIGYGKGYYDKYLERNPGLKTIGVCFDCQMEDEIPFDIYDKRPDMVITESRVYQ